MSRTHKHAPYWVSLERDGHMHHDHRDGDCDYSPEVNRPDVLSRHYRHQRRCKKSRNYTVVCTHVYSSHEVVGGWKSSEEPTYERCFTPALKSHERRIFNTKTGEEVTHKVEVPDCFSDANPRDYYSEGDVIVLRNRVVGTVGYTRFNLYFRIKNHQFCEHVFTFRSYYPNIPCECDEGAPGHFRDRCVKMLPAGEMHKYFTKYHDYYEEPEPAARSEVNINLHMLARAYNGGEDPNGDEFALLDN